MVLYSGNLKNQNRVIRFKPCWHGVAVFRAAVYTTVSRVRVKRFGFRSFRTRTLRF